MQTKKDKARLEPALRAPSGEASTVLKSLRRILRAIDIGSKKAARTSGLTIPQLVVLQAVRDLGEVTTNALSAEVDLSAATVVTILDKLEERDLIERYRSTSDRRIVHSRLTAHGGETLAVAPPLLQEEFVTAFDALPEATRAETAEAFERVARLMSASSQARPGNGGLEGPES